MHDVSNRSWVMTCIRSWQQRWTCQKQLLSPGSTPLIILLQVRLHLFNILPSNELVLIVAIYLMHWSDDLNRHAQIVICSNPCIVRLLKADQMGIKCPQQFSGFGNYKDQSKTNTHRKTDFHTYLWSIEVDIAYKMLAGTEKLFLIVGASKVIQATN